MKKKKTPEDYDSFQFRISPDDKTQVKELIDELHRRFNEKLPEDAYKVKKNQIIVGALKLGLQALKKRKTMK